MFGKPLQAALPPAAADAAQAPTPKRGWLERAVRAAARGLAYHLMWRPLRWEARRMWNHRELHATWAAAIPLYGYAAIHHAAGGPWWFTPAASVAAAAASHWFLSRHDVLPITARTAAATVAVAGAWTTAATFAPFDPITATSWAALTMGGTVTWGVSAPARRWRSARIRVRYSTRRLPGVLGALTFAGVAVAARPAVSGTGRTEYPLRLTQPGVTRRKLEKAVREIEQGMDWSEGSIRGIIQDPKHSAASRIRLIHHEGGIKARTVRFDPPQMPHSVYDRRWLGITDEGEPYYVTPVIKGYGATHSMSGGATGSTKSNLLRLRALLAAYTPTLIWVIDLKSGGKAYAHLLPRIDRIAVTEEQAAEMMADAAAMVPLRAELLLPEHNQVLPASDVAGDEGFCAVEIFGDEIRTIWAKTRRSAAPIVEDTNKVTSESRAFNIGVHAATQYWNQDSAHPKLLPNFTDAFAGRTRYDSDSQFLLRRWNRYKTSELPAGAFYVQSSGSEDPILLYTPEVTDSMLMQTAAETETFAPALEAPTADRLPHYRNRWAHLPDNLLQYASEAQKREVREARIRLGMEPAPGAEHGRAAAADDKPVRLIVSEQIDDTAALVSEINDPHLRALAAVHLSPGLVSTAESNAAVAPSRSRQWAHERRAEWRAKKLVEQTERGKWQRTAGECDFIAGVLAAEETIRARRGTGAGGGGEATTTGPDDTPDDLHIHPLEGVADLDVYPDPRSPGGAVAEGGPAGGAADPGVARAYSP
ncbi:hypothetical protein ABZ897_16350 [Nonomuraea sp. NPDC046802]|uniref:hypothetical protein n=1 Tax=Nonomuraea sp. NPDC046802 TaxID=3154919 RepID=UPI0033EB2920